MVAEIKLITRGDDLGSAITANKAIMDCYKNGILKNTSIMVPAPYIEEAADMFKGENICFGLHCTITAEWDNLRWGPVLPPEEVPSLVNSRGEFFQTTVELENNEPDLEEIMKELKAQLKKARELGFNIEYADMHMGFGQVVDGLGEEFFSW
ncbi:MAG: ChbG/HpnK family deacetylase, partial [Bacillota bacterium]